MQLKNLTSRPMLRRYVERISAILNDCRTADDYRDYLAQAEPAPYDPDAKFEEAAEMAALQASSS